MSLLLLKRYRNMFMIGIFCFYLGCGLTVSFLKIACAEVSVRHKVAKENLITSPLNSFDEYEFVILVISGPENQELRTTIRNTWGILATNLVTENGEISFKWNKTANKDITYMVKVLFVIGTEGLNKNVNSNLKAENNMHNDLILLDNLKDSYKNLSAKVLYSLKWVSTNMNSVKYVLKCDDDSFVRVDLIVRELDKYAPYMDAPELKEFVSYKSSLETYKGLYWGYFNGHAKVFFSGKWQEKDWFLCDTYLPYALGGGYVISRSIVDYLARNADELSLYTSEDVSMGTWTAALSSINRVHDIRFDTEWRSRGCSNEMLVRHKQTSADMYKLYKTLSNTYGRKLCAVEQLNRKPYSYNWSVMPSKCCSKFT